MKAVRPGRNGVNMKAGNWTLVLCGFSHKTALLEQREPLQLGTEELARANALFGSLAEVMESVIVSTCNRGEFYFVTGVSNDPFDVVSAFYKKFRGTDVAPHRALFYVRKGLHAADHLFRVAAGIDSMVLGENQIVSQLKNAYSSACAVKAAGKIIHRLFHQSFRVAKRVRTDTVISQGACSVSTAAVEMLKERLQAVGNPTVLFVGVNQTVKLAAQRVRQIEGCRLVFANRTARKAEAFAAEFGANGFGLDGLPELLERSDFVFSGTSSPEPIVSAGTIREVMKRREGRGLVVVDMAVPRDFEVAEGLDPALEINDLEDIKKFVSESQYQRELAVPQAEEIVDRKLGEFGYWYDHVLHEPIYNGRSNTVETIREEELRPLLEKLSPELRDELNRATRRIVDRVIRVTSRPAERRSD